MVRMFMHHSKFNRLVSQKPKTNYTRSRYAHLEYFDGFFMLSKPNIMLVYTFSLILTKVKEDMQILFGLVIRYFGKIGKVCAVFEWILKETSDSQRGRWFSTWYSDCYLPQCFYFYTLDASELPHYQRFIFYFTSLCKKEELVEERISSFLYGVWDFHSVWSIDAAMNE